MVETGTIGQPQVDDNGQQTPPNPPQNGGDDKLRALHDAVSKDYDIGSFDDFKKNLSDPNKRQSFFNTVGKDYDLGSYDNFQKNIGIAPAPEHQIQHTDEHVNDFLASASQNRLQQNVNQFQDNAIDAITSKNAVDEYKRQRDNATRSGDVSGMQNIMPPLLLKSEVQQNRENYKNNDLKDDPSKMRHVIRVIGDQHPDLKPQLQSDLYTMDATGRNANPNKIASNKADIESGKYNYNPETGQLQEPQNWWKSISLGYQQRNQALNDFDFYNNHEDAANINKLENERINFDPDVATKVPAGVGHFTSSIGSEGIATAKSVSAGLLTNAIPGGEVFSPYVAAAVSTPEYYQRQYATSLPQHYNELRNKGLSQQDAYKQASDMASFDAKVAAAQMAVTTAIGGKLGLSAPELNTATKSTVFNLMNKAGAFGVEAATGGVENRMASMASQMAMNLKAGKPIDEDLDKGAVDQMLFPAMIGGLMKGAHTLVSPLLRSKMLQAVSQYPDERIKSELGEQVMQGHLTDLEAQSLEGEIKNQRGRDSKIPLHVTDDETRGKISDLMDKYDEEKDKLETTHDVYKPTIKARMDEIKTQINDLSGTQPQENIRTKKVDFDKTAIAKDILNEKIKEGTDEWTKNDIQTGMAKADPEGFLNFISEQDRGQMQNQNGETVSSSPQTREQFGDDLTDAANEHADYSLKNKENENKETNEAQKVGSQKVEGVDGDNAKPLSKETSAPSSPDYLLSRHADTVKDEQNKVSGPNQSGLSSKGVRDANDLADDVLAHSKETGVPIKKVVHSDLERARETGDKVADKTGAVSISDKGLRTWDIGDFDDVKDKEFKQVQDWFAKNPDATEYKGDIEKFQGKKLGESLNDYAKRTIEAHKPYENEKASTMLIDHSNNMMVMDAYRKNGNEWNENAIKDYINAEKPEPATLVNKTTQNAESQSRNSGQEQQPSTITENNSGKPPTGEGKTTEGEEENKRLVGLAEKIQRQLNLKPYKSGQGMSTQETLDFGQAAIDHGVDPEKIATDPKYTDLSYGEKMSVLGAHNFNLTNEMYKASDKFGVESKQYQSAAKALTDFQDMAADMRTDWSIAGQAQKAGEINLNTGSFTALKTAAEENIKGGGKLNSEQEKQAKEFATKINEHEKKINDLVEQLKKVQDDNTKITVKPQREKLSSQLNDIAKRLRTSAEFDSFLKGASGDVQKMGVDLPRLKEIAASILEDTAKAVKAGENAIDFIRKAVDKLTDDVDKDKLTDALHAIGEKEGLFEIKETPEEKNIKRLERQLEDLQSGKVKNASEKREQSGKEKELKEQIFEAKKNVGLVKSKQRLETELDRENDRETLAEKFLHKEGNTFTPQEAKGVSDYARKNYIDKGITDFNKLTKRVADDLGLTQQQVIHAINTPKGAKAITDGIWKEQYRRRLVDQNAKLWVRSAGDNKVWKTLSKIYQTPAAITTALHATVLPFTHVGSDAFRPTNIANFLRLEINTWKFAYPLNDAGKAHYEQAISALMNDPNYRMFLKAKANIDPTNMTTDDYQGWQNMLHKLGESGVRAFNAIKVYRLAQMNALWDKVNPEWKYDAHGNPNEEVVKAIANHVNLATGTTSVNFGDVGKVATGLFFAPKLVTSQVQRITTEPLKAFANTALWAFGKAKPQEIVQAKMVWRYMGEMAATYAGLLAINYGVLKANGSNQKINVTDPTKEDYLKFKGKGYELDATGGLRTMTRFFGTMAEYAKNASVDAKLDKGSKNPGDKESAKLTSQLRGKLSPSAQIGAEFATGTDVIGRPTPWSNVPVPSYLKREGIGKQTWAEYGESKLPIFMAEGFKGAEDGATANGMPKTSAANILQGLLIGVEAGTIGARINPDYSLEKKNDKTY